MIAFRGYFCCKFISFGDGTNEGEWVISSLAKYKQWKIDCGYLDPKKDKYETLRDKFKEFDSVTAKVIDLTRDKKTSVNENLENNVNSEENE